MNDCTNADVRDQLPDLLHDRLTVSVREVVVAHVADCSDCREELELLRGAHGVLLARTPRIDVGLIVASLPKPPGQQPGKQVASIASAPSRRFRRVDWRIAAAVTFLAVGGSSVALLERTPNANRVFTDTSVVASVPLSADNGSNAATVASSATPTTATPVDSVASPVVPAVTEVASSSDNSNAADEQAVADVSPGGRFAGLTSAQLQSLLGDIGQLPDVPVTEPDPVSIDVTTSSAGPGGL